MTLSVLLFLVFLSSILTSLVMGARLIRVPASQRVGERIPGRRLEPIPRLGGVAVCCALPLALVAALYLTAFATGAIRSLPILGLELVTAGAILFAVGLFDDLRGVRPIVKLTAQTAAALLVYRGGFSLDSLSFLPGYSFDLGWASLPVTVLWLVGVSNAFNLIDGLDGLAGGVGLIALVCITSAALILGHTATAIFAVALGGALIGFLPFNIAPARLFLGDSGSLVVGFLLAVLSVRAATNDAGVTYALLPIFALSYLLLDTGIAILRRWLRGVPLSRADSRHIHHQLASLGLPRSRVLTIIYIASAGLGVLGLSATFAPPEITLLITVSGVAALIAVMGFGIYWLQYHEFFEAGASLASGVRKARWVIRDKINARDIVKVIQHADKFEEVQAILEDSASMFGFAHMKLHTTEMRRRPGRITQELQALKLWKLEYPIVDPDADETNGLSLTIWCSLEASQRPAGAERVARIIGPAIVEWAQSGKYKQPVASYGDRLLHTPYTPFADTVSDRALLESVVWHPSAREEARRHQAREGAAFDPIPATEVAVNASARVDEVAGLALRR